MIYLGGISYLKYSLLEAVFRALFERRNMSHLTKCGRHPVVLLYAVCPTGGHFEATSIITRWRSLPASERNPHEEKCNSSRCAAVIFANICLTPPT